jgi:hypothetical protein
MSWSAITNTLLVLFMAASAIESYQDRSGWHLLFKVTMLLVAALLFGVWLGMVSKR